MDLYDILIAKKLAGGGGGGGGNVETATIVITVTNGTATITSGAFPDWCTADNNMNIYGQMDLSNALVEGEPFTDIDIYKVIGVTERPKSFGSQEKYTIIKALDGEALTEPCNISTDLEIKGVDEDWQITDGEITINLIYMPN